MRIQSPRIGIGRSSVDSPESQLDQLKVVLLYDDVEVMLSGIFLLG